MKDFPAILFIDQQVRLPAEISAGAVREKGDIQMEILQVKQIHKIYGEKENKVCALRDVSFSVEQGEFIAIVGTSGSGKSTLLNLIGGLDTPTQGKIIIRGHDIASLKRKELTIFRRRNIGFVFQDYSLMPVLNVYDNVALPVTFDRGKHVDHGYIRELLHELGLWEKRKRYPNELSGGQQQRVALARIMAYEPDVILLDEPFSALDMYLKDRLQQELMEMLADYKGTVIMVSHNRDELYRFSGELLVIDEGHIVAAGETKELFRNPVSREAARLTGCKNFSRVRRVDAHTAEASDWGVTLRTTREIPEDTRWFGYRAHDFVPIWGEAGENMLRFDMESSALLPFERNYYLRPGICWFVQRERIEELDERGLPDCVLFREDKILFLK